MRRVYKVLAVLIVLGLLAAGGLILAVRFLPDTDLVRSSVQDKLRAITGYDVVLGSLHVSTSFPRLIRLRVEGVSVNSPQGRTVISADNVVLSPSLISVFSREIRVEAVTVTGLRAVLEGSDAQHPRSPAAGTQVKPPAQEAPPRSRPEQSYRVQEPLGKDETTDTAAKRGFRWSLSSVRLVDARIDWIDRQGVPGKELLVSLNGIDGALNRSEDHAFQVKLSGLLELDKAHAGPVNVSGTIKPSEELSELDAANIELTATSLSLKPLRSLIPAFAAPVREFSTGSVTCRLSWERSRLPKITYRADLKVSDQQPAQLNVQGEALFSPDFSRFQESKSTVETGGLPLRFLQTVLPEAWPLDPQAGVVKASIQVVWLGGENWRLSGTAGVENALLKGVLKGIAKPIRSWAQFKLDPEQLLLESLEVSGVSKILSIAGKVTKPLSTNYGLDLRGDIALEPNWLGTLGIRLPGSVEIQGAIPVRGAVRGESGEIWVDANGDLAGTDVHWTPYLRKAAGAKGHLSFKGKILAAHGQKDRHQRVESQVRLSLSGTSVRLAPQAPWLTGTTVQLDSRVLDNAGKWDLREANLAVRRGAGAGDMIVAKANVAGLETGAPKIDAAATVTLDKALLSLAGIDLPLGSTIVGNAPAKLVLGGPSNNLDWSAELALTHLDINVKQAFRKPGGLNGSLSASGKLSGSGLTLGNGRLSLPGLVVQGQGTLVDPKGNFGSVSCTARKSDLKDVAKLFPPAAGLGLSGPADASILVKGVHDTVTATGTIRLLSVEYRPEKAAWGLEKVKGNLELDGSSLTVPEVSGNIVGTLEGPFKVKGSLSNIGSTDALNGSFSLSVGQGRIRAEKLRGLLSQAQLLIGTLLNPQSSDRRKDPLEIQFANGDFQIHAGTVRTENLTIRGADVSSGAIGTLRLASNDLDVLVGVHTVTAAGDALGKIPAVRQFIKKHEGLLSATGLDKELKRFGLDTKDSPDEKADASGATKTPVTVLFRLHGPAGSPQVTPVFEHSVNKATLSRLKSLIN